MIRIFTQAQSVVLLAWLVAAPLRAADPSAEDIVRSARLSAIGQQAKLRGQLRTDAGKTPFIVSLEDGVIRYAFTNPEQVLELRLGEDGSELRERLGGKNSEVKPARFDEKIRGSGLTYEDIAFRLLYWPRPKLLGSDNVMTRPTWKLEIQAPRGSSQYGVSRLWIDKESGAVMMIEGFGMDGRILKRFKVISGQRIDGRWTLKSMRVESFDPETHKIVDRSYLEILGEAK